MQYSTLKHALLAVVLLAATPLWAEDVEEEVPGTDQPEPAGFVTELLNKSLDKAAAREAAPVVDAQESVRYGRKVTDFVSVPRFGGYFIGSYKYSSQEGKHHGEGFNNRLVRAYVDGTVLHEFAYRLQIQYSGTSVHLKDAFIEWQRFKEFRVKAGQYKRIFTFEDPYNPWDVGTGDYSQLTKKLSGMGDYCGESSIAGGRDMGLQIQGDLFPVGRQHTRLIHYQMGVFNGQGINTGDANGKKDWMGSLQLQPVKGLYLGVFGWKGTYTQDHITVERNRWAVGAKYEGNWSARAEYAHNTGHRISDFSVVDGHQQLKDVHSNGRADAWYVTVGAPCTSWLKVYAKYDAYRETASNGSLRSMYSLCPNFQLHKNLLFQLQYNYVHDKTAQDRNYHELWAEAYIRF